MSITLSDEQERFVQAACSGKNILVDACIGSGKTTAIQELCNRLPGKRILYLTYNKILKLDAKAKITNRNVLVSNYHGYAFMLLKKINKSCGIEELIKTCNREKPPVEKFDMLIMDEYQDIDQEISEFLTLIKDSNPGMQIIAVGDMDQKIYDRTLLDVRQFMTEFLGTHDNMYFTKCFRISPELAATLGRIWEKPIDGVNPDCEVEEMTEDESILFLSQHDASEVLCLGAKNGSMSSTLNKLETEFPEKYNKQTVYATIADMDNTWRAIEPGPNVGIFTTYDSCKGLERPICVVFDFTESYWSTRTRCFNVRYEIMKNIFCVAASRGKRHIIFVKPDEAMLSEETLSTPTESRPDFPNVDMSSMFDYKKREDVEAAYECVRAKKIDVPDTSTIEVKYKDGMIDLSPCVGIYNEASFFSAYDVDHALKYKLAHKKDQSLPYGDFLENATLEEKILFYVALETNQKRYYTQAESVYVDENSSEQMHRRLLERLTPDEEVQTECRIEFADRDGQKAFTANGMCDVQRPDCIYELKFVQELQHTHFLQLASYLVANKLEKGYLWNIYNNAIYEVSVPDTRKFLNAVCNCVTGGVLPKYTPVGGDPKPKTKMGEILQKANKTRIRKKNRKDNSDRQ